MFSFNESTLLFFYLVLFFAKENTYSQAYLQQETL